MKRFHPDPGIVLERLLPLLIEPMNAIVEAVPIWSSTDPISSHPDGRTVR